MSKIKNFLHNHSNNNKIGFVIGTAIIIFILNFLAIIVAMFIQYNSDLAIINPLLIPFIAPKMISASIPVSGAYYAVIVIEAYLIMLLVSFLTKNKPKS